MFISQAASVAPIRFDSLAEMQAGHAGLVKEVGNIPLIPESRSRIVTFVRAALASGAVLDAKEDRAAAQGLINFWTARLTTSTARDFPYTRDLTAPTADPLDPLLVLDDTLLAEFDPSALDRAQADADRWLATLSDEDRRWVRRLLLRLVRLGEGSRDFVATPTTRAGLRDISGLSVEKADELIAGLSKSGVVRVTQGAVPRVDQVALRSESLPDSWATLHEMLDARLRFRDAVEGWDAGHGDALLKGDALNEARDYHDRNETERKFVEASRREEWRESQRNRTLLYVGAPLLIVALVGWITSAVNIREAMTNAAEARQFANKAEQEKATALTETRRAVEQTARANQEMARATAEKAKADVGFAALKERQHLTEATSIVRTLAIVGNETGAAREIALHRLDAARGATAGDAALSAFFAANREVLTRLAESSKNVQDAQVAALNLARDVKRRMLGKISAMRDSKEITEGLEAERRVVFDTAEFCAGKLVDAYRTKPYQDPDAEAYRKEFWVLYWGEMGLVEGHEVEEAMVRFGKTLEKIDERIAAELASDESIKFSTSWKGLNSRQAIQQSAVGAIRVAESKISTFLKEAKVDPHEWKELQVNLSALRSAIESEKKRPWGLEPLEAY